LAKRIGDIVDLPRAPLTARFGSGCCASSTSALGLEHEPLTPRLPVAPYVAEQRFAEPIAREEDVSAITGRLARRLQFALERRGDGARRIELTLFRTDGVVRRIAAGTSRPLRDRTKSRAVRGAARRARRCARSRLRLRHGAAVGHCAESCPPEQIGIGGGENAAEFCRLVDRLSARLGARCVRLAAQDSHIPELAETVLPAQAVNGDAGWNAFRRYREEVQLSPTAAAAADATGAYRGGGGSAGQPAPALSMAARAARVIAAEAQTHRGCLVERARRTRAIIRVEDKSGLRFWLFRTGLYRDLAQGAAAPTWFLHGTFA
jgi:protein ImuB